MVNGQSPSSIFVRDGERGAGYVGAAAQASNETFDEQRFATSQLSLESQNRSDIDTLRELPPDRLCFSWTVGNERSHLAEVESS